MTKTMNIIFSKRVKVLSFFSMASNEKTEMTNKIKFKENKGLSTELGRTHSITKLATLNTTISITLKSLYTRIKTVLEMFLYARMQIPTEFRAKNKFVRMLKRKYCVLLELGLLNVPRNFPTSVVRSARLIKIVLIVLMKLWIIVIII